MSFRVNFSEHKITFPTKFKELYEVSDGGYDRGYEIGHKKGHAEGYEQGETDGYTKGEAEGYDRGHTEGYNEGSTLFKDVVEGTLAGDIVDDTITRLRNYAFYGCKNVTSLTLNNLTLSDYASVFQGMTSLETLNLPLAKRIGYTACQGCTALKNVYIPNADGNYGSFHGCSALEFIDLPKYTYMNDRSFYGCTSLKTIILRYKGRMTLNKVTAFTNTPFRNGEGGTIYVPQAYLEQYQTATNWNALESTTFLPIEGSEYE